MTFGPRLVVRLYCFLSIVNCNSFLFCQATGIGALDGLRGFLELLPDNAFQRARPGENFDLFTRVWAVVVGGMKLFGVGIVSSIATLSVSNGVWAIRKVLKPDIIQKPTTIRSPVMKTAFVYASFLGISSNLRYQVRFKMVCWE